MRSILIGLCLLFLTTEALSRGPVRVRGYTTKNGTYVAPHYRSAPDRSRSNNWSTRGNVNPYTGKAGTKNPYGGTYYPFGSTSPGYPYQSPSYRYTSPTYGYGSSGYGQPGYGSGSPSHNFSAQAYRCPDCSPNNSQAQQYVDRQQGEILLASGAVKVPANTQSGYCLRTPYNYVGTGAVGYPAVTSAMPRCIKIQEAESGL